MILHEIFRVVPRFPHYISCYKAENHFLWDSVYTQQWTMNMGWTWDFSWHCPFNVWMCRMTKCTFHKYGGSGTIQKFDALCVLGMNIINEKVSFNFFLQKVGTGAFSRFRVFAELFKSDVGLAPSRSLMLSVSWVWTLSTRRLALIPPTFFYIHRWAFSSFWRNSRTR